SPPSSPAPAPPPAAPRTAASPTGPPSPARRTPTGRGRSPRAGPSRIAPRPKPKYASFAQYVWLSDAYLAWLRATGAAGVAPGPPATQARGRGPGPAGRTQQEARGDPGSPEGGAGGTGRHEQPKRACRGRSPALGTRLTADPRRSGHLTALTAAATGRRGCGS